MSISPKERFLDICHFKRPGDLWLKDGFWGGIQENWVEQGAPKEIMNPGFCRDYFQIQHIHWLSEIKSSIRWWTGGEGVRSKINLGHGITMRELNLSPCMPAFETRIISEDARSVTYTNSSGIDRQAKADYTHRIMPETGLRRTVGHEAA